MKSVRLLWERGCLPYGIKITDRDIDSYEAEFNRETWEGKREKIKETFKFSSVPNPPFHKWINAVPVQYLSRFRGLPAFNKLSDTVVREGALDPTRELNVLYPGSGSHVAPLITAMNLIDKGKIRGARFTYTEIKERPFDHLRYLLDMALDNGVFDEVAYHSPLPLQFKDGGTEQVIELTYKGRQIQIVFALNCSGDEYYRPEYLNRADVVVIHDIDFKGRQLKAFELLAKMLLHKREKFRQKRQLVIMDGEANKASEPGWFGVVKLDQLGVAQEFVPGPYGHCSGYKGIGEMDECYYSSARVFRMDEHILMDLAAEIPAVEPLTYKLYMPAPWEHGISAPPAP